MDKFIKTGTGGLPLKLDDLMWENGELDASNYGIYEALQAHLRNFGTDYIVSGCVYTAPNLTAGWIFLNEELIRVDAHVATNNYFTKVSTIDSRGNKTFKDSSSQSTYQVNRGVLNASSGTLDITTALRLQDVIVQNIAAASIQEFAVANIPDLPASKTTSGTFDAARIPDLDAAKITTGTFDTARIPSLDTAKITTGVFTDARIPNLDTAKITTGIFVDARIPNLAASKITSGIFAVARIPSLPASIITSGVIAEARLPIASTVLQGIQENATIVETQAFALGTLTVTPIALGVVTGGNLTKVIDIGDWNMDATSVINVAHGLTYSKIRATRVTIRNDADTNKTDLSLDQTGAGSAGYFLTQSTIVSMNRIAGAAYDSTLYDSTSYNRGWIIIDYIP